MAIGNIVCPSCGKEYLWQQQLAGHSVRCTCGQVMPVPNAAPQQDSVYALAPSEDARPQRVSRTPGLNIDDLSLPCPACGQPIEFGGVVCTSCGYNVKTGEHVRIMPLPPAHNHAPSPVVHAPPINVPEYAVSTAPAPREVVSETRRDVLLRYLGIVGGLLLLIIVVSAYRHFSGSSDTEDLTPEDREFARLIASSSAAEARAWLEGDGERMLGGLNRRQAEAQIDEIYRYGAAKVWCTGGRMAMGVVVELPADAEKRRRFFDWQRQHHAGIGEPAFDDTGQKYLRIMMPR